MTSVTLVSAARCTVRGCMQPQRAASQAPPAGSVNVRPAMCAGADEAVLRSKELSPELLQASSSGRLLTDFASMHEALMAQARRGNRRARPLGMHGACWLGGMLHFPVGCHRTACRVEKPLTLSADVNTHACYFVPVKQWDSFFWHPAYLT